MQNISIRDEIKDLSPLKKVEPKLMANKYTNYLVMNLCVSASWSFRRNDCWMGLYKIYVSSVFIIFLSWIYINQGRMKSTFPVYTDKKALDKSRPNTTGVVVLKFPCSERRFISTWEKFPTIPVFFPHVFYSHGHNFPTMTKFSSHIPIPVGVRTSVPLVETHPLKALDHFCT